MPESVLILGKSIFAFGFLLVMCRLMGKKQISQLTFFDYVVGITIGSIAATMAVSTETQILNGIIGILVWGILPIVLGLLTQKSLTLRHVVDGTPTVLVKNGQVLEKNLQKVKMTENGLMLNLREKNTFKLADVELALLETNGKVSVMKKSDKEPITPKILGMNVEQEKGPDVVVIDGQVVKTVLNSSGYSLEWLEGEVKKQGASSIQDVFFAQIDSKGNVYVDLYHDRQQPSKVMQKPLLLATLKKVQADLEIFALQTKDQGAKKTYQKESQSLQKLVDQIQPYLK